MLSPNAKRVVARGRGEIPLYASAPLFDLSSLSSNMQGEDLHYLLFGSADTGHILKTLGGISEKLNTSEHCIKTSFYIYEIQYSTICRHIALLYLLFGSHRARLECLKERSKAFTQVHYSVWVEEHVLKFILSSVEKLRRLCLTDGEKIHSNINLDFMRLRFRERDVLAEIFKLWASEKLVQDVFKKEWNNRLILHLQQRYDLRENVFDWDFHMDAVENIPDISKHDYLNWRKTGSILHWDKNLFPNSTVVAMNSMGNLGICSEVATGPFPCLVEAGARKSAPATANQGGSQSSAVLYEKFYDEKSQQISKLLAIVHDALDSGKLKINIVIMPTDIARGASSISSIAGAISNFHAAFFGWDHSHRIINLSHLCRSLVIETINFQIGRRKDEKNNYEKRVAEYVKGKTPTSFFLLQSIQEKIAGHMLFMRTCGLQQ